MIRLEPLTGHHDRSHFACGVAALDVWLRQTALQHQGKGVSRSFVAVAADAAAVRVHATGSLLGAASTTILGYYALASAHVALTELPREAAKRYPRLVPVTRLGRLAIRTELQGQGLGRLLLADAVQRARAAALDVGSAGLFVDAKDAGGASFYQRYGFRPGIERPLQLFLPFW